MSVLISYLIIFFFLNLFFDESKSFLGGKKGYYFTYTILEYLTFTYLIWRSIMDIKFRNFVIVVSLLFTVFLIFFYTTSSIQRMDSVPIGIESILLLSYIICFFYYYFKNVNGSYIYDNAFFWIIAGILIYVGFTFFFNILANSLNKEFLDKYFFYGWFGDILKNTLFGIAIVFFAKKTKNKPKGSFNVPHLDMI